MTGRILPPIPGTATIDSLPVAASARVTADVPEAPQELRSAPTGRTVEGTVLGRNNQGHLLVRTQAGVVNLATRYDPPPGTQVMLRLITNGATLQARITAMTTPTQAALLAASRAGGQPPAQNLLDAASLTRIWPALDRALATPETARTLSGARTKGSSAIPTAGTGMAGGLAAFLQALSAGEVRDWLGSALDRLAQADGTLARQLERDFGQLSQLAREPQGDWRVFAFPVAAETGVHQMRLFVREHDGEHPLPETTHHFIVEGELPALGEFQLDGLIQPGRFDMILRTRAALADSVQSDLTAIAAEARRTARLDGSFQLAAGPDWRMMAVPGQGGASIEV
ncbi:hypothetical protein SAMN05216241_101473 [Limimonas halophila]|uniref:Hook-length control protein FliK n=1 Tax=Limimonas halophila TaxID=1082479 RepID=A0A1G7M455_9PROT|nr:hypothetical protein [Limimonas halophila]SDF56421.1 hypothetical protein SAMN05216241_101473 [Limimonas halophila]